VEFGPSIFGCPPFLQDDVPYHDILSADREGQCCGGTRLQLLCLLEATKLELRLLFVGRELDIELSNFASKHFSDILNIDRDFCDYVVDRIALLFANEVFIG